MKSWENILKLVPEIYQEQGVKFLREHHYAILGDRMGLGKTLQALMIAVETSKNILVVCPSYLKYTWADEVKKYFIKPPKTYLIKDKKDIPDNPENDQIIILGYSRLKDCIHLFKWCDIAIADEVHFLKNHTTKRTNYFHTGLTDHRPARFVGLSGTPIKNRVPEFYTLIKLCDLNPSRTSGEGCPLTYWQFCHKFTNRRDYRFGNRTVTKFEGAKNIPLLKRLLHGKYLRRTKVNSLNLPKLIYKEIYVDYNMPEEKEMWEEFNEKKKSATSSFKAKSAILKAKFTAKYTQDLIDAGEGPILVFTEHLAPVDILLKTIRGNVAIITGGISAEERHQHVQDFQAGKLDALICTIGAGSTGFTLHAANHVVFNDLSWVPADNDQAVKRIHRIGQDKTCFVHRILGSTIDGLICKKLDEKSKVLEKVL